MSSNDRDFALLLDGAPQVDADLAEQILAKSGIPCLLETVGIDAQLPPEVLGQRTAGMLVYVPKPELERARNAIEAAWGEIPARFDPRAHD